MLRDMLRTATAIVLVSATCSGVEAAMRPLPEGDRPTFTVRITEDDPRWDCETMGNMQCGPTDIGTALTLTSQDGSE